EQLRIDLGIEPGALVAAGAPQPIREPALEFAMRDKALGRTYIVATSLDRSQVRLQLRQHARPVRGCPCSAPFRTSARQQWPQHRREPLYLDQSSVSRISSCSQ